MARRGPRDIADAAVVIIEGMKGKSLDEEIKDVMTDAIWDGRESAPAPVESETTHEETDR